MTRKTAAGAPGRRLSPGERDLWGRVTRDVAPLAGAAGKANRLPIEGNPTGAKIATPSKRDLMRGSACRPPHAETDSPNGNLRAASSIFDSGDPRADRLVRRGRRAIDGEFDLHGHTQNTARGALLGFLTEARLRGSRCVLIITGKGAPPPGEAQRPRGVLKKAFQTWLNEPAFRQHVVRASAAHPRHGGGGAFYVFLRR